MKKIACLILSITIFAFCTSTGRNAKTTVVPIKEFQKTIWIKGEKTKIQDPDIGPYIYLTDSIIIFKLRSSDYCFRAYDLATFEKIGNFLRLGNGPNEVTLPQIVPRPQKSNNQTLLFISNFPKNILLVNLTRTLKTGKTVVKKEYNFATPGKHNLLYECNMIYNLGNNTFLMDKSVTRSRNAENLHPAPMYILYNYNSGICLDTLPYRFSMLGLPSISPDRTRIVSTSFWDDLISIYHIPERSEIILSRKSSASPENIASPFYPDIKQPDYTYLCCDVSSCWVFALYSPNIFTKKQLQKQALHPFIYLIPGDAACIICR